MNHSYPFWTTETPRFGFTRFAIYGIITYEKILLNPIFNFKKRGLAMLFSKQTILILFCGMFFAAGQCWSKEPIPPPEPPIYQPFKKLSRGLVNVVTAPLEVPNQMYWQAEREKDDAGRAIAGYIEGVFIGTGWTIARFLAGSYDIITFPIPPYKKSLIQPEYIFDWHEKKGGAWSDW
jgi:putative exosortase-associated protein (TIGR04073 family)